MFRTVTWFVIWCLAGMAAAQADRFYFDQPTNGSRHLKGERLTVSVRVKEDGMPVRWVFIYLGRKAVASLTTPPYRIEIDTTSLEPGLHYLRAVACLQGRLTLQARVRILVAETSPPDPAAGLLEQGEAACRSIEAASLSDGRVVSGAVNAGSAIAQPAEMDRMFADSALWSGCWTAALAMRAALTGRTGDRESASRALGGLLQLAEVAGPGVLARGMRPAASPDEAVPAGWQQSGRFFWMPGAAPAHYLGVVFGASACHQLAASDQEKAEIVRAVTGLIGPVLEAGMALPGKPEPLKLLEADPLTALEGVAVLRAAGQLSGEGKFPDKYRELIAGGSVRETIEKGVDLSSRSRTEQLLCFASYHLLLSGETDPDLVAICRKGMAASLAGLPKGGSIFAPLSVAGWCRDQREAKQAGISALTSWKGDPADPAGEIEYLLSYWTARRTGMLP